MNSSSNIFSSVEGEFSTPPIYLSDGYTEQAFNHLQDDWSALSSNTNIHAVEAITTEVKYNDPKILLEEYHKIKEKQKQIHLIQKNLEKELEDVKQYNTSFDRTIHDSLRLFGKNEDVSKLIGKLSITVKGEVEMETVRIQSLLEENKLQKEKCFEEIGDYVKLLKECITILPEEERTNFENPYLCGICVENNISHVFRPCGHTICQTCLHSQHLWNCHICRKRIDEKLKIFFS
jgi:hypothetical protein